MSTLERIFHSVLFEAIALLFMVFVGSLITGASQGTMLWISVTLSLFIMVWNYGYNLAVDKAFGEDRSKRDLKFRILHGLGFEGGAVFLTVPFLMWALDMGFWKVLVMDIGIMIFFLIYAIIYNWVYDNIRARVTMRSVSV